MSSSPLPTTTLWRPTGPVELDLVRALDRRAWPPRLPEQPIFYPVLNEDYAVRIARDWNVRHDGAGFVTRFEVDSAFLERYPVRRAARRSWSCGFRRRSCRSSMPTSSGGSRWCVSSAEEIVYAAPCPSCPATAEVTAGLAWTGGRLEWGSEHHCEACGAELLDCGRDEPPAALRGRLLAAHGPTRLEFPRAGAAVMKVLRAELGLSLADVRRVVREGYEATGPEAARLAEALRRAGPAGQPVVNRRRSGRE